MNALYEDVRIMLYTVWRRRWLALAVAWGVCLLGWLAVSLIPNRYEFRARVLVEMQSLLSGKMGINENDAQKGIDRVRQTFVSNENLLKVVKATELSKQVSTDADAAAFAAQLGQKIKVNATPDNVFEISAETSFGGLSDRANARLAHDVVQRLIGLFVEANLNDDRVEAAQSLDFLDQEISQREKALREVEARKVHFEQEYLGDIPGSGSIDQRADAIRAELMTIEPQLASAEGSLAAANAQLAGTPATIVVPGAPGGGGRLAQLEGQLADAQAKGWTDQHPDVQAIKAQVARLRASGAGGPASTVGGSANPAYMSMRAMQAERAAAAGALQARRAQLQASLNRLRSIQISQPDVAAEQARLARDYQVLKDQYDKMIADREDIRLRGGVAARGDVIRFRVIQPPFTPRLPAFPNRPLLLFGVLLAGLGAGVGVAFLTGQLKTSFPTGDRLAAATGLPVLGSIPRAYTPEAAAERAQRLKWFFGASGALVGAFVLLLAVEFIQRGMMA